MSTLVNGHAHLVCIVPNTDCEGQGDAQGHSDAHAGTLDTRVSAESRRIKSVLCIPALLTKQQNDQGKQVLVTTVSHVKSSLHQTTRGNEVPGEKKRINVKLSRVETSVSGTANDVLKSTVKIEIR